MNIRSAVTKNILNELSTPVAETKVVAATAVNETRSYKAFKEKQLARRSANEAQNARTSWMSDIVNAAASLKGLGKSCPDEWTSKEKLAKRSNAELWEIRGKAVQMVASANADEKTKKSLVDKAQLEIKSDLMKGSDNPTMESAKPNVKRAVAKVTKETTAESEAATFAKNIADAGIGTQARPFKTVKENAGYITIKPVLKRNADQILDGILENLGYAEAKVVNDDLVFSKVDNGKKYTLKLESFDKNDGYMIARVAVEAQTKQNGTALSICPLCGSSTFDTVVDKCPVCKENYGKYRAVEAADFNLGEEEDFTTLEIDGEDKILIDEEGNTATIQPDELEGKLVEHSHELIIEENEEPIIVDSGLATEPANEGDEGVADEEGIEDAGVDHEVAFLKFPMGVEECLDLLQQGNEDFIEVVATDEGYEIIVNPDADGAAADEPMVEDVPAVEDATEADEPDMDEDGLEEDMPVEPEFANEEDQSEVPEQFVIILEELAVGTVVHIDGVDDVNELVQIVNELLPDTAELVDVMAANESEEMAEDAVDADVEEEMAEDELDEPAAFTESAKPVKRVKAASSRITTYGNLIPIDREGREGQPVKIKTIYESKLPKITKKEVSKKGKVDAKGKPTAKSVENTSESVNKHEFIKRSVEAIGGSPKEARKLAMSLWDAIKMNKGGAAALLNTLEAAAKVADDEIVAKQAAKQIKSEKPAVKKMDKTIKFGQSK